jgi:HEAT repeat protein
MSEFEPLIPQFAKLLKDPDECVRCDAASMLARFGPQAATALPALIEALDDKRESGQVWAHACSAFTAMGPQCIPALIQAMKDPRERVQKGACYGVEQIARESGKPAAKALQSTVDPLMKLATQRNGSSRASAVRALGPVGEVVATDQILPLLLQSSTDASEDVREAAAYTLGGFAYDTRKTVPALVGCLQDPRPRVQIASARQLGGMGKPAFRATKTMILLFLDSNQDATFRMTLCSSLQKLAPEDPPVKQAFQQIASTKSDPISAAVRNYLSLP